jgi:phosphonate metabolism protein (transferase hexapeptide repeat family)
MQMKSGGIHPNSSTGIACYEGYLRYMSEERSALLWQHSLSEQPFIDSTATVRESELGGWTSIGPASMILESKIGDYTYTSDSVIINYAKVGKFCSIASHAVISPVNHPMDRVMQHHATYRRVAYGFAKTDDENIFAWRRSQSVTIGHDVWIGHGATIMPGRTIGTGAVVGSGAVVTHDVEPYTIVGGVPAKPIRERFPREIAEKLLQIAWWDWPREKLEECFADFNDLELFLKKHAPTK